MSSIRVTYSGLISLAIGLSSIVTGLVFTVIVTRQLTQEEFGTWNLIGGLIIYVIIIEPIISYWTIREVSRGTQSGRTAIFTSGIFSTVAIVAYLIIAYFVGIQSGVELDILFLSAILVPVVFLNNTLSAITIGWKPQAHSYGFLVFELAKIPTAIIFIYYLQMGMEGVIFAVFFSTLANILTLSILSREKLKGKISRKIFSKWIKLSWLPTYQNIPPMLFLSDFMIFSVITGSVTGAATFGASKAVGRIVMHTRAFSKSIYPKLLSGGKQEYLQENLIRMFYFAFPLMGLSLSLARPGLFTLNPIYEEAVMIVFFLTFRSFLSALNKIFFASLSGIEKVDIKEGATFKEYIKSKLFFLPTLRITQYISYVVVLIGGLLLLKSTSTELELVIYWSIVAFVIEIPFVIYLSKLIKKNFTLKLDYKSIFKYLSASVVSFGILHLMIEQFLNYRINIFEFLPELILFASIGIALYIGITYVIDKKTRILFKAIFSEIKRK